jgi:hypothetical protein
VPDNIILYQRVRTKDINRPNGWGEEENGGNGKTPTKKVLNPTCISARESL